MAGHSPAPVVEAVQRRIGTLGGITAMLPTDDAEWVAAELSRRFGMARWSFALTATDANRFVLRFCRYLTGRRKVLVFDWCYHGSVDETLVTLGPDGRRQGQPGEAAARSEVQQPPRAEGAQQRDGGQAVEDVQAGNLGRVADGRLELDRGPYDGADVIFTGTARHLAAALYSGMPLALMIEKKMLTIDGDRTTAEKFVSLFPLPAKADLPTKA